MLSPSLSKRICFRSSQSFESKAWPVGKGLHWLGDGRGIGVWFASDGGSTCEIKWSGCGERNVQVIKDWNRLRQESSYQQKVEKHMSSYDKYWQWLLSHPFNSDLSKQEVAVSTLKTAGVLILQPDCALDAATLAESPTPNSCQNSFHGLNSLAQIKRKEKYEFSCT